MSKKESLWKSLPQVPVIKENLDDFFQFMYERHMIWYKRFVLKQPPPWTKDKILRDYKFTNIRRDLDHGTIWYMKKVVPMAKDELDLLWLTVMYRILNRVETFERVGLVRYERWTKSRGWWMKDLKVLHKKESIFTSAHLTLPVGPGHKGMSKLDKYRQVLDWTHKHLRVIHEHIMAAIILKDVWLALREIPCVGPFIAYEIACDLILTKMIPFTEDDWANAGPGCKRGIRIIFPTTRKEDDGYLKKIKELRDTQDQHFKRLGLDFQAINNCKPLSLRSIEHSLCEYQKYWQCQRGVGKHRMIFKPRDCPEYRTGKLHRFPR